MSTLIAPFPLIAPVKVNAELALLPLVRSNVELVAMEIGTWKVIV